MLWHPKPTQINSLTHWTVVNANILWECAKVNVAFPDVKLFGGNDYKQVIMGIRNVVCLYKKWLLIWYTMYYDVNLSPHGIGRGVAGEPLLTPGSDVPMSSHPWQTSPNPGDPGLSPSSKCTEMSSVIVTTIECVKDGPRQIFTWFQTWLFTSFVTLRK